MKKISRIGKTCISSIFLLSAIAITSCSNVNIKDFENTKPVFRLEEYFQGESTAWGVVLDRSGGVVKQFEVALKGTYENKTLKLEEKFKYSDGTESERIWTVVKTGENLYEGTAGDVVGKATGRSNGNALNWSYTLLLPVDGSTMEIQFDDWMFLQNEKVLINKAVMTKYGIYVGEILIFFTRK
jgi:hypothetical protein